jgi:hypothetical protein
MRLQILGYARTAMDDAALRDRLKGFIKGPEQDVEAFLSKITYHQGSVSGGGGAAPQHSSTHKMAAPQAPTHPGVQLPVPPAPARGAPPPRLRGLRGGGGHLPRCCPPLIVAAPRRRPPPRSTTPQPIPGAR